MKRSEQSCLELFITFWAPVFLIIFLLVALCSHKTKAQECVYVIHTPADFGFGGRVDYHLWKGKNEGKDPLGFYTALSYGDGGVYARYGLRGHYKLTAGILITLTHDSDVRNVLMVGGS